MRYTPPLALKFLVLSNKLIDKRNWIAQYNVLKNAIPKAWTKILKSENSCKSYVKTYLKIDHINLKENENKTVYNFLVSKRFTKPYIHNYWIQQLNFPMDPLNL